MRGVISISGDTNGSEVEQMNNPCGQRILVTGVTGTVGPRRCLVAVCYGISGTEAVTG